MSMHIFLTGHLRKKIRERRISLIMVEETARRPELTLSTYSGREERYRKFRKNYLMVVVKQESTKLIILTAHWVDKLPKQ